MSGSWQVLAVASALGLLGGGALLVTGSGQQVADRTPRRIQGAWLGNLADQLARAGWRDLQPHAALGAWLGLSLLAGVAVWLMIPIPVLAPLAALATLAAGRALIASRIGSRERRLRHAWPGVVDHLRSAVRSGASVGEAMVLLVDKVPEELRPAFNTLHRELERGTRLDTALSIVKEELANPIADRIVESLRMAHEVGGRELPHVLEALQASVRSDLAVREDALAKQSWIRAASKLGVTAPWLVLAVLSGRQETIDAYQGLAGTLIIITGAVLSVVAYKVMSRLGRLPDEGRWFA